MSKSNEVKFDELTSYSANDYFNLPNPGLKSYFDKVKVGQPDVYDTPFCRHNGGFQKILADWQPILEKHLDKWPSLLEFENDLKSKVGPMSVMKPLSQRLNDVQAYYDCVKVDAQPLSDSAIKATINKFKQCKGMALRSEQKTVDLMKKSTSSGSPYFTKRKNVVKKTVPCHVLNDEQSLNGGNSVYRSCAVLGWRGQEGGPNVDDVKQRVVWMMPFAVNIQELRCYQPLIEQAQKFNLVPAWVSMESVDASITRLFDTKGKDDLVICTDFSKFDQHFNTVMQDAAKTILAGILNNSADSRCWLESTFPVKYNIPLALSMTEMCKGEHGMASGSGGTNADETLTHTALQFEAALEKHQRLNPNSMCLGDDGVLTYPGITVEDVVRTYEKHGQEMNVTKQYASKHDCVYLRRWHHADYRIGGVCVGVYSTYRALGRLCEQERYYDPDKWSAKMVALRQLSILENVKYHPAREDFAKFCMKRDKFRLGLDIPGFLDNIETIAKESIELMPDFLGYTKSMQDKDGSGISNWWIVKYLKSMR
nr:MAG: RNA-dependent RNA polymerase [Porcine picobirnavirus]